MYTVFKLFRFRFCLFMFQGNWTCSKCGGEIKELPFEPRSNSGLTCRDCYFKEKDSAAAPADDQAADTAPGAKPAADMDDREAPIFDPSAPASEQPPESSNSTAAPASSGERQMFTGDWKCSICGNAITQLPFEPRNTENLKCIDCFKKSK